MVSPQVYGKGMDELVAAVMKHASKSQLKTALWAIARATADLRQPLSMDSLQCVSHDDVTMRFEAARPMVTAQVSGAAATAEDWIRRNVALHPSRIEVTGA